jgi:hypothetical protein
MREVAAAVPLDRLFIETDSPFLTPVPNRGKRNEPAFVKIVAEKISEAKGIPFAEVEALLVALSKGEEAMREDLAAAAEEGDVAGPEPGRSKAHPQRIAGAQGRPHATPAHRHPHERCSFGGFGWGIRDRHVVLEKSKGHGEENQRSKIKD